MQLKQENIQIIGVGLESTLDSFKLIEIGTLTSKLPDNWVL